MAGVQPSSYYSNTQRAGASLNRARRPYLFRNIFTGIGLAGFTIGVFLYTMRAIGTDEFDDVKPVKRIEKSA